MPNEKNNMLELLRLKAERLIDNEDNHYENIDTIAVKKIFYEVEVYQLELEQQNDELQQTAIELEQQKNSFTSLFELAPISYFVTNRNGTVSNVNRTGIRLLGFDKTFLLNKPLLVHIYKEDTDIFYKYFNKLIQNQQTQSCTLRFINSQKQVLTAQIEGVAMYTTTEASVYLTLTDITQKQIAEKELTDAKKRLAIALYASSTGIWEMDILSGEIYLDNFCRTLYNYDQASYQYKYENIIACIHPNDRKVVEEQIRKTISLKHEFNIKFRTVFTDGNIKYIQARAQVVKDQQSNKRLVGTFTDISEKTMLEIQANRVKEEQQQMILAAGLQAEENEKKRISEVLHNGIAQMLYAIKLNLDQIKNKDDTGLIEQIDELLKQSIKDVRNVSFELAPAILTDFGLAATLEDMAMRLGNAQLSIDIQTVNIGNTLDFQLQLNIFRIIQELVNNCIKHAQAKKITVSVTKKNRTILINVDDDGKGFKNDADLKRPKGIGLSSIKNRLRLYKGSIKIDSKQGTGTAVQIVLKKI